MFVLFDLLGLANFLKSQLLSVNLTASVDNDDNVESKSNAVIIKIMAQVLVFVSRLRVPLPLHRGDIHAEIFT